MPNFFLQILISRFFSCDRHNQNVSLYPPRPNCSSDPTSRPKLTMVGNPFGPLSSPSNHSAHKRPPALLESTYRRELIAFVAEFIGTFLFLFFAFGGTQVANTTSANENAEAVAQGRLSHTITASPSASVVLYIALVFGFSLTVNVWIFFRVSGGLFNPAVSLISPSQTRGMAYSPRESQRKTINRNLDLKLTVEP